MNTWDLKWEVRWMLQNYVTKGWGADCNVKVAHWLHLWWPFQSTRFHLSISCGTMITTITNPKIWATKVFTDKIIGRIIKCMEMNDNVLISSTKKYFIQSKYVIQCEWNWKCTKILCSYIYYVKYLTLIITMHTWVLFRV